MVGSSASSDRISEVKFSRLVLSSFLPQHLGRSIHSSLKEDIPKRESQPPRPVLSVSTEAGAEVGGGEKTLQAAMAWPLRAHLTSRLIPKCPSACPQCPHSGAGSISSQNKSPLKH